MRRAAIAGVLAMESDVLVLDEPTDGLDPGGEKEFYSAVRRYCDETGKTVVLATHAVPDLVHLTDCLGHLACGQIQSSGPPDSVLAGSGTTLPLQFLPDHLIIASTLARAGLELSVDLLDPDRAREYFLNMAVRRMGGRGG